MRALQWAKHQLRAKGADSIHSPFVFELHQQVISYPYDFSIFEDLEQARETLLADETLLEWKEAGAGKQLRQKSVAEIAGSSLMPYRKAAFLFKLCRWLKPEAVLELGTSLGLTTAYLASPLSSPVWTFEAVESLGPVSEQLWAELKMENIHRINGPLEKTLPEFLKKPEASGWELAVVDANHRYQATLDHFHLLKESLKGRSACVVFDDIYWSREMTAAWLEIQAQPDVDVSLDFFDFGVVFFRPESSKEHFTLQW